MTNKDSTLPPIPHLHSLLTDNGEPHPEVDIFKLVRSSYEVMHRLSGDVCAFPDLRRSCLTNRMAPPLPVLSPLLQKFGSIRADVIEQMRFKQRLRVIQTIEDTTKRNVVRTRLAPAVNTTKVVLRPSALFFSRVAQFQVRTIVTETAFSIDELEELFLLFKVRLRACCSSAAPPCLAPHQPLPVTSLQVEHLTSCYWGGSSNPTERHDPSLPYLEQYRIDVEQFKGLFKQLFPWANGAQSDLLAVRFFRLLDQNCDGLINFREFINGLGRRNGGGRFSCVRCCYRRPLLHLRYVFQAFCITGISSRS